MKEVQIGKSTYAASKDSNPSQVGGADNFVVCFDGRPLVVRREQVVPQYVTYREKRAARTTAINIRAQGVEDIDVFDKQKGKMLNV